MTKWGFQNRKGLKGVPQAQNFIKIPYFPPESPRNRPGSATAQGDNSGYPLAVKTKHVLLYRTKWNMHSQKYFTEVLNPRTFHLVYQSTAYSPEVAGQMGCFLSSAVATWAISQRCSPLSGVVSLVSDFAGNIFVVINNVAWFKFTPVEK